MIAEYVDILTADGASTGRRCLKSEAHKKGHFHPTVHVWLYTKKGEILMQQRGANKQTFPNLWDVSVAGHVMAGELILDAAYREIKEEIGLQVSLKSINKIGINKSVIHHDNGINDCEFQHVFMSELYAPLEQLVKQDDEVQDLRLFSIDEFKKGIKGKNTEYNIVPSNKAYYDFVLEHITEALKVI